MRKQKEAAAERPGVMLYFDSIRPAVSRMSDEQAGVLLRAILDYAQYGELAELDAMEGMAFDMLRPAIDRDAERYEEAREQRQYAAYSRELKRRDEQPLPIAEWRETRAREDNETPRETTARDGRAREEDPDGSPSPTTTTASTTTPSTATTTASAPTTSPAPASAPSPSTSPAPAGVGEGSKGEGDNCAGITRPHRRDEPERAGQGPANTHPFDLDGTEKENRGQARTDESPARWRNAGRGLEKTGNFGAEEVPRLYLAWKDAVNAGDRTRALTLSNRLYSLGYEANLHTRQLSRRP